MNKRDLATLAVIGIGVATGCQKAGGATEENSHYDLPSQKDEGHSHKASLNKQAFYNSLSTEGKRKFSTLNAQHQMMAIEMANQSCNGKNECAGMGGCKSANNSCAGKNACKGQGGSPVHDNNKVVMIQHHKQMKDS